MKVEDLIFKVCCFLFVLIAEVQCWSQTAFLSQTYKVQNGFAFAAIAANNDVYTWGESVNGGSSPEYGGVKNVSFVTGSRFSFASLAHNGSVGAWGSAAATQQKPNNDVAFYSLVANEGAYAGIVKFNSQVVSFGDPNSGGGFSGWIEGTFYDNFKSIASTAAAFAGLTNNGAVVAWGNGRTGGSYSSSIAQLQNVKMVAATREAFTALLRNGSVFSWGSKDAGGSTAAVRDQLDNSVVFHVVGAPAVFAAFTNNTNGLVVWGYSKYGGDAAAVSSRLGSGVSFVAHTSVAMAAIKEDGSVVAWGHPDGGGDSTAVQFNLVDITMIYSNSRAFAAVTSIGSVVAWGKPEYGGTVPSQLMTSLSGDVAKVFSTHRAFAALKQDGSLVVWGQGGHGGAPSAAVQALLSAAAPPVVAYEVCSTDAAFAAITTQGQVIAWGHALSVPQPGVQFNDSALVQGARCVRNTDVLPFNAVPVLVTAPAPLYDDFQAHDDVFTGFDDYFGVIGGIPGGPGN
jgi:alpha-tubulin suppressor-like RCC1 family protein